MKPLTENETWKLVVKPDSHRLLQYNWIYKVNEGRQRLDLLKHGSYIYMLIANQRKAEIDRMETLFKSEFNMKD